MPTNSAPKLQIACGLCDEVSRDGPSASKHKSQRHSVPVPISFPDGTVKIVEQDVGGGYVCWCSKRRTRRDTCIAHVREAHLDGDTKILIFLEKGGGTSSLLCDPYYILLTMARQFDQPLAPQPQ